MRDKGPNTIPEVVTPSARSVLASHDIPFLIRNEMAQLRTVESPDFFPYIYKELDAELQINKRKPLIYS